MIFITNANIIQASEKYLHAFSTYIAHAKSIR